MQKRVSGAKRALITANYFSMRMEITLVWFGLVSKVCLCELDWDLQLNMDIEPLTASMPGSVFKIVPIDIDQVFTAQTTRLPLAKSGNRKFHFVKGHILVFAREPKLSIVQLVMGKILSTEIRLFGLLYQQQLSSTSQFDLVFTVSLCSLVRLTKS